VEAYGWGACGKGAGGGPQGSDKGVLDGAGSMDEKRVGKGGKVFQREGRQGEGSHGQLGVVCKMMVKRALGKEDDGGHFEMRSTRAFGRGGSARVLARKEHEDIAGMPACRQEPAYVLCLCLPGLPVQPGLSACMSAWPTLELVFCLDAFSRE